MFMLRDNLPVIPDRNIDTYKRLVSLAIGIRNLDKTVEQTFRLCIPHHYVTAIAWHFPTHNYNILGGCFTEEGEAYVRWSPVGPA